MKQTLFKHVLNIAEHQHLVRITESVRQDITESQILDGLAVVFCPHSTAVIAVGAGSDPDAVRDLIYGMEKAFPSMNRNYRRADSHARLKALACGATKTLIVEEGKLVLGEDQDVYFCEFDGPKDRTFYVKILEG
ncbi:MAG: secondary thiamine-phosphate synthase enzyme YjbQ [Lachnospiraceae bacterium]|nr:secondary thiamine-phosphate synthase enzyme YjbQ [Lachnospiraceae bacterium]